MNKRQQLKSIKRFSNETLVREAGLRGIALLDFPYRNMGIVDELERRRFAYVISHVNWDGCILNADIWSIDEVPHVDMILTGV